MHRAIIAQVERTQDIPGADNIHVAYVLGEQVIVSKATQVGHTGILFPTDLQLSEEFCYENSINRQSELNKNPEKKGFFDKNRRVRTQPFLKVKSTAYFTELDSVSYTGVDVTKFALGDTFDELNGKKICQKYISEETRKAIAAQNRSSAPKKNYAPLFDKHVDSDQFKHCAHMIPAGALIHIHAKVHGTSHRSGLTWVTQNLPWWKNFVNKISLKIMNKGLFATQKMDYVVGTRNVVLKAGDEDKEGFHGSEGFRFQVAESLKPFLEEGMLCFGEVAGFANGKPIMAVHNSKVLKDKEFTKKYGENIIYKYGCKENEYRFHIYRITRLIDGENVDLSQEELEAWCERNGFLAPVKMVEPFIYDGNVRDLQELVEALTERPNEKGEDVIDPSHPTEGVIIRVEIPGVNKPKFYKNKAYAFKVMEGIAEAVDTEDAA